MTIEEAKKAYEEAVEEYRSSMLYAMLSYDDPNYAELSKRVWDLMDKVHQLRKELKGLIPQEG